MSALNLDREYTLIIGRNQPKVFIQDGKAYYPDGRPMTDLPPGVEIQVRQVLETKPAIIIPSMAKSLDKQKEGTPARILPPPPPAGDNIAVNGPDAGAAATVKGTAKGSAKSAATTKGKK